MTNLATCCTLKVQYDCAENLYASAGNLSCTWRLVTDSTTQVQPEEPHDFPCERLVKDKRSSKRVKVIK